jgi:Rieske Fe-S protein
MSLSGGDTVSQLPHDPADRPARDQLTRRAVLGVGAAGTGAALLAACGSGSSDSGSDSNGKAASSGTTLAKLADIPVGQAVSAKDGGKPVIVSQPTAGKAACFSAKCTHMGCTVKPAGKELHCPCHGSRYDASTGKVLHGPAPRPLDTIAVHVAGGSVVTGAGTGT